MNDSSTESTHDTPLKQALQEKIAKHKTHDRDSLYQLPDGDMGCLECDALDQPKPNV